MNYPDDADGQALSNVARRTDMTKQIKIDFFVDVPDETVGKAVSQIAVEHGYSTNLEIDSESQRWTCYCSKVMLPTYENVVQAQSELDRLSAPFGGRTDGWGTHGK